jgi:tRNA(Ile)-lysidine synthase
MSLRSRALETIRRHGLLRDGSRVLVGLSGGADSVALLLVLRELERDGVLAIAGAAHVNHLLRGAESDGDETFCAALAAALDVPFRAVRIDVAALARAQKRSVEDAARSARYSFFERIMSELGAGVVAVAHTREDQAETFLLRLLRGSGTRGLAAIHPRAGRVIRPLLDAARDDLRAYLSARGQAFRDDSSNADLSIPRNRVRHELIPTLRSRFSAGIIAVLAREAALARQDEEFLQAEAIKLAGRIVLTDVAVRIDAAGLSSAPRALSSRVAQMALGHHAGSKPISFDHVEQVLALAADDTSLPRRSRGAAKAGAVSLPGQFAVRAGGTIVLSPGRGQVRGGANSFAFSLSIPGEVELGPQRLAVGVERVACLAETEREGGTPRAASGRQRKWVGRGSEVGVAAAALELPLAVRSRRPGDRFRPLGAPGGRKLQDFLVDRKVPRAERDELPLVVDGRDRIVWVVGQAVAEDFRVTDPSQGVLLLKVRRF